MSRVFSAFRVFIAALSLVMAARAETRSVDLVISGPVARIEPVEQAVQDPLSRLPIEVRLARAERVDPKTVIDGRDRAAPAFARVWVDLSAERQVTLYFVDRDWERILVRHVAIERNLDDVEREEIAQVIRSAVEALLGGATIGISRDQARAELLPPAPKPAAPKRVEPPPDRPTPPPPPPRNERRVDVGVGGFYAAELYAQLLWHGPGLMADVGTHDALSWGGRLTLQYRTPTLIEGEHLGARLQGFALRALARGSFVQSGFVLFLAAGPGVDLTNVDPTRVSGDVRTESATWDAVPVIAGSGGAGLAFSSVRAGVFAGADFDLVATRHVAERNGEQYTVFETSRLRPFFGLELLVVLDET